MPRIASVDPASAPDAIASVLAQSSLNLLGMVAHAESAFEPWLRYSSTLLGRLELDPLLRELAILEVAQLSESEYEWTQHVTIALAVGASQEQVDAIEAGPPGEEILPPRERSVVTFTREVVIDGAGSEAAVEEIVGLLGERQLVELLLVIGNYMGIARLIATVGLEAQDPVVTLPPRAAGAE
jgi:4-carboxymuconolactone decarboxylase